MASVASISTFPLTSRDELVKEYLGKSIKDVPCPAAILDLNKLKQNCDRMLEACTGLDFGWRAHIKTHKTTELTRLQVGEGSGPVNLVVSTIIEAELITPLLLEYKAQGRAINLLYAFPITPSSVPRLAVVSKALGPGGLSIMIDHLAQLESATALQETSDIPPSIFLKIDMGAKRAGVPAESEACSALVAKILSLVKSGTAVFHGIYAHAGHSYSSSTRASALDLLRQEFEALLVTAKSIQTTSPSTPLSPLILSVGATPTATSIRNLLLPDASLNDEESKAVSALKATMLAIRTLGCTLEIHAGVYPTLDVQQLSTYVLPSDMLKFDDLAFSIIAEVASLYPNRGNEALVTAGTLALGREPCKAYTGWGIVTPWNREGVSMPEGRVEDHAGWIMGRINQEHGILTFKESGSTKPDALEVGQKLTIWPNHSCVAGACFGWYFVVDSSRKGKEDEIVDVWVRWRGW